MPRNILVRATPRAELKTDIAVVSASQMPTQVFVFRFDTPEDRFIRVASLTDMTTLPTTTTTTGDLYRKTSMYIRVDRPQDMPGLVADVIAAVRALKNRYDREDTVGTPTDYQIGTP